MQFPSKPSSSFRPLPAQLRTVACVVLAAGLVVALTAVPGVANAANQGGQILGDGATVYRALLVDEAGNELPADVKRGHTLFLEVSRLGLEPERFLVPGTDDSLDEVTPNLSYSNSTQTLFLVWEHRVNALHSRIRVASFREDSGFSELIDLVGNPYYAKQRPTVFLTTDSLRWKISGEGEEQSDTVGEIDQRVLHTVWREEQGHVYYTGLAMGTSGELAATETIDLNLLFPELSDEIFSGVDGSLDLSPGTR